MYIPKNIKNYIIEDLIGSGAFGKVYRIHDINDINKLYALKQMKFQDSDYLEKAIETEILIMKKVENKNSVKLYDAFDIDEFHYMILELCDGDLQGIKRNRSRANKPFNELEVLLIISQLNDCFRKMREGKEKIIHRDLKLANIMIKYDKNVPVLGYMIKLSDFGLSKELNENELTTTTVGTPLTQAPEVLSKEKYDSKCDLWSIGVIIYELIFNKSKHSFDKGMLTSLGIFIFFMFLILAIKSFLSFAGKGKRSNNNW